MGYELNRLMQQFGLSSPTVGQYTGDPSNTVERSAFDKYKADVMGRLNITPQYAQAQFQTKQPDQNYLKTNPDVGAAYTKSGSALSPEGFARQHYMNYGQFEGRAMPTLPGNQYWSNTLQAPKVTPYTPPSATPEAPPQSYRDGDSFNYGKNTELNMALVGAIPRLRELMPSGFGTGAFHTTYGQLKPQEKTLADSILARGYADGGFVEPMTANEALMQRASEVEAAQRQYQAQAAQELQRLREMYEKPSNSGMYLRLAQAFGSPTKTGTFGETMANAAGALGDVADARSEARRKAVEVGLQQSQLGMTSAQQSYENAAKRAELENELRNRQMIGNALNGSGGGGFGAVDANTLANVAAMTNNPTLMKRAELMYGREDKYNEPREVTLEDGRTVLIPAGQAMGLPNPRSGQAPAPLTGSGNDQEAQVPIGRYTTKLTPQQEANKTRMSEDAKKASQRQDDFLKDLEVKAASHTSQAKAGEQILQLTQPTGLAAPGAGSDIKLGAAKAIAAVSGMPLGEEWANLEVADKKSKEMAFRQRENFQKDPNMSQMDLKLYTMLPPGITTSYAGNKMLVEMSKLQAEKTQLIKNKASDWIAKYGSLDTRKRDPRTGRMINFYDLKDELASQSAFTPLYSKLRELGVNVDGGEQ